MTVIGVRSKFLSVDRSSPRCRRSSSRWPAASPSGRCSLPSIPRSRRRRWKSRSRTKQARRMRPHRTLDHPRQTRPAGQIKKATRGCGPAWPYYIGITDGDRPSASPYLVFYIQLYTQKYLGKEQESRYAEIVTHIDTASSACTNLHHAIGRSWTNPPLHASTGSLSRWGCW